MYIKIVIFILSVLLMGCRDNVFDKILCDLETDSLNYASYLIIILAIYLFGNKKPMDIGLVHFIKVFYFRLMINL